MRTIHDLNKQQLSKFIEGFDALINETADSRGSFRGYKGQGFEAARTIVLARQIKGEKDVHAQLRGEKLSSDLAALQSAFDAAADQMGYGPNSSTPIAIA